MHELITTQIVRSFARIKQTDSMTVKGMESYGLVQLRWLLRWCSVGHPSCRCTITIGNRFFLVGVQFSFVFL